MKTISKFTAGGNVATTLTVLALVLSGYFLHQALNSSSVEDEKIERLSYHGFSVKGIPVSLGVMAYCFGGHGAFPKIYSEMANKNKYLEAVSMVAAFVMVLYAVIISVGYFYYGEHTKIPVTVNIGSDLNGDPLSNAESLKIIAALGLICNIQATCPIMVITISEMVNSVLNSSHDALPSHEEQGKAVSNKIILTVSISALLIALFLREYFLQVCGIVGAFATITSSIFLPIIFYHKLYGRIHPISYPRSVLHVFIVCLAFVAMFFGVTSSVCAIVDSDNALCDLTVPS